MRLHLCLMDLSSVPTHWKHSMSEKISPSHPNPNQGEAMEPFWHRRSFTSPWRAVWPPKMGGQLRRRNTVSWKAVHGIQAGSGRSGDFSSSWEWISELGGSSYQLWIFCGATHFEQSHGETHASLTFCQKHSARVPPDRCFSTTFVSGFALGGSCSMCFWSETWLLIRIFFQRLQLPKDKLDATPAGLLLETWRCRGRCFLPAGRWLCEGSLKHQRRVALSRRPRREVAFEGWKPTKNQKFKGEGFILGVRLFMGTVGGFRVRDRFKWMYIAHSMQYIFFWSCFCILCKDSFILVWAYPNRIPNPMGGLMRQLCLKMCLFSIKQSEAKPWWWANEQVFFFGKTTPSEMLSKMFESSHIRAMYTGSQDVAPKSAGRRTTTGQEP